MKQGLSLRVSQHLALTPQLQQSIRLLQLSTLELSQEIDQMLDDNPFLEKEMEDLAPREDFGLEQENTAAETSEAEPDNWDGPMDRVSEIRVETASEVAAPIDAEGVAESWDGDGSVEFSPDDSEWGGDAPARNNNNDDEKAQATELARNQESLTAFLHRQALSLRLDDTDRAALRFLIESINDDGYVEDSFQSLAESLAGDDLEQCEELVHRFQVALGLLQSLEPTGVGARDLGECLALQAKEADRHDPCMAKLLQNLDLLARGERARLKRICDCDEEDLADMIRELSAQEGLVLATGGGAVLNPASRALLAERGTVIYLRASIGSILQRTSHDKNRPLLQTADPRAKLEELLAQQQIDPTGIHGYATQEPSHAAVAQAVASGAADAGLGIEAAALEKGLDFIALVRERYHLVCLKSALEQPPVKALLQALQSPAWAATLAQLPGYSAEGAQSGQVLSMRALLPWWQYRQAKTGRG